MKVVRVLIASMAVMTTGTVAAQAVDVRQVTELKASPAAVWAKVGEWCAIKTWHPAIANCDASKKGFRTLTLKDGGKIVEKLTKTGPNSYSYDIVEGPLPVKNYKATFAAKADSLGSTDLTWTAKFDAKGKSEADASAVINGIFEAGLKNIKDTMKFDAPSTAAPAAAAAAAVGAAATTAVVAPTPAIAAAAAKDEAKLKAREERRKRFAAAKLVALEKYAKFKAAVAEKARATSEAAKAAYEKAKAALTTATQPKKS
jgi:hypothetical protein